MFLFGFRLQDLPNHFVFFCIFVFCIFFLFFSPLHVRRRGLLGAAAYLPPLVLEPPRNASAIAPVDLVLLPVWLEDDVPWRCVFEAHRELEVPCLRKTQKVFRRFFQITQPAVHLAERCELVDGIATRSVMHDGV